MKSTTRSFTLLGVIVLFSLHLGLCVGTNVWAGDASALLKEVSQQLRQAERDMFAGKAEKAIASLEPIKERLMTVKAEDPNNPGLKTMEKKYEKLVKDLERRTGKDLGGGTLTAAGASTEANLPSKPEVKALPAKEAPAPVALTGDTETLAKEADTLLRDAEKNMFSGKNDEAAQQLGQAEAIINKIKTEDPENARLGPLENKCGQVHKKLEAKMPKAAPENAGEPQTAQAEKAGAAAKLPYDARAPYSKATSEISRIDGYIERLKDPKWNRDQLVGNMDTTLSNARKNLDEAKALAAQKGVTSHPDFDKAEADLAAAEQKAAEAKQAYQEGKAVAAAQSEEVNADVQALLDEYNRVRPVFDKAMGVVIYYNDLEPVNTLLADIENFEKNDLDSLKVKMDAFAQKYGSTREEIDQKADAMGYSGQNRASFPYTELAAGIENVQKTREVMAADLIRKASEMRDQTATGVHGFYRLKHHAKLKEWGQTAAKFDPNNAQVKEYNAGIDAWIAEDMKAFNAEIDKVTWPGHGSNAPDDAKELASVAMKFLQEEEDKRAAEGKESSTVLAVVVKGPWRVFKKNILGEPIQYNLPILSAVQTEEEKGMNLARVYDSTLLTQEGRGVKMAPPFIGATVGNSYYIRPSKVK